MKDYDAANIEQMGEVSDVEQRLMDAYGVLLDAEKEFDCIKDAFINFDLRELDICNIDKLINDLKEILGSLLELLTSTISKLTSILSVPNINIPSIPDSSVLDNIPNPTIAAGLEDYCATGILLKKFQVLKFKMEKMKLLIERKVLEITNGVLVWTLNGRGSMLTTPIQVPLAAISALASVANTIMTVLGSILSLLSNIPFININAAGAALFMTPKSMMKTDITIANSNQSTTNSIPSFVDTALTEVEESIKKANGVIKKSKIAACAADGAASAAAGSFEYAGIGNVFEKFDPKKIRDLINALLATLFDADALPRYEKLNIINVRFLVYLVTGFEPAAKKSFGIPGMP